MSGMVWWAESCSLRISFHWWNNGRGPEGSGNGSHPPRRDLNCKQKHTMINCTCNPHVKVNEGMHYKKLYMLTEFLFGGEATCISPQVNTITTTQEYTGGKLEVLGGKMKNLGGEASPLPPHWIEP